MNDFWNHDFEYPSSNVSPFNRPRFPDELPMHPLDFDFADSAAAGVPVDPPSNLTMHDGLNASFPNVATKNEPIYIPPLDFGFADSAAAGFLVDPPLNLAMYNGLNASFQNVVTPDQLKNPVKRTDKHWICGGNRDLQYIGKIGAGGFGEVHRVSSFELHC